mmetsp:Transcript_24648/g.44561  ORF Transcript_24648/g.44561 Transcript_24648/m.44561 type:complete len:110 (+) Transcript_24648:626-955(+)
MIIHCYPWKSFGPLTMDDIPLSLIDETPDKLYPCYQSIKLSITDPDLAMPKFSTVPQLFVAVFHSQFYLDLLNETDGCAYKEYNSHAQVFDSTTAICSNISLTILLGFT